MNVDWVTLRGHALVLGAVTIGIIGMSMVFNGAMAGNLHAASRGMPLLLIGLWWAGRELRRSMDASRARRAARCPLTRA